MINYIYISSGGLTLFIIALIVGKKHKEKADYILASWFLLLLVNIITFVLTHSQGYPKSLPAKLLLEFSEASVFLHGPLFWFYIQALTLPSFSFGRLTIKHFVPFAFGFLLLVFNIFYSIFPDYFLRLFILIFKMIALLYYVFIILKGLHRHRHRTQSIFSNLEDKSLQWVAFLATSVAVLWVLAVFGLFIFYAKIISFPYYAVVFVNLSICLFVLIVGYFGIQQQAIFVQASPQKNLPIGHLDDIVDSKPDNNKYKKTGLNKEKSAQIFNQLLEYMREEKPFLDENLTLFQLAERLKIQPNILSQSINENAQVNFFDFVNNYRVDEIKKTIIAKTAEHQTLLGIALSCGFNSKASFNRAFKKQTGMTPSEWKSAIG